MYLFNAAQPGVGRVQVLGSKKFLLLLLWEELYVSLYAQGLKIVGRRTPRQALSLGSMPGGSPARGIPQPGGILQPRGIPQTGSPQPGGSPVQGRPKPGAPKPEGLNTGGGQFFYSSTLCFI